ncbi:hypothetical protein BJ878DRAFT_532670 [Calycina marina]|uniref:SAP domain-containing protein n=1 Tax=Calycina marina TaxID=1763456 RepID=A0A9P8CHI2_9HELO|nr:hypothetical protein BJ878DRAFT_532670 [Calycina marina]
MTDYSLQKVPDLKRLLSERGLVVSGKKDDLVVRLQQDDDKKSANKSAAAEDEIDWDEDDNKAPAITEPAAAAVAAGGQGPVDTPIAVPNQQVGEDFTKPTGLTVAGGDKADATPEAITSEDAPKAETAKPDFSMGIEKTDAELEAEKRAARAKRFGLAEPFEEAAEADKKLERAKKFGLDAKAAVVKGLDDALPDRKKRGREPKDEGRGGRNAKRQTPDRRTEAPRAKGQAVVSKPKPAGAILDDPVEKSKAEARAKRFATA